MNHLRLNNFIFLNFFNDKLTRALFDSYGNNQMQAMNYQMAFHPIQTENNLVK